MNPEISLFLKTYFLYIVPFLSIMLAIITIKKDTSIGNFTWGGIVMITALYSLFIFFSHPPQFFLSTMPWRQIVATSLTLLWGLRLAIHTYSRYRKGADPRFVAWQQSQGSFYTFAKNFGWIFGANLFMGLVMSLPIMTINFLPLLMMVPIPHQAVALHGLDYLAIICWLIGFYFESVADYQLSRFTRDPANKGKVLGTGLWRYSRHPNYFGEITMWWSIFLMTLAIPDGWLTIVAPITVTITLIFVTGIPWLEKAMADNPAYQEYKKHTSMLIPWPPKNN